MPLRGQGWGTERSMLGVGPTDKQTGWLGVISCSGVTSLNRNILNDLVSPRQGSLPARSLGPGLFPTSSCSSAGSGCAA